MRSVPSRDVPPWRSVLKVLCIVTLVSCVNANVHNKRQSNFRYVRQSRNPVIGTAGIDAQLKALKARRIAPIRASAPTTPVWDCPSLPTPPAATNVHQLRPGNIQAIMALGDSMTAGFCMHCLPAYDLLDLYEYRGDVYSVGGNEGALTLPNILKNFNPNLQGAAIGKSLPLDAIKWKNHIIQPFDPKVTHLNGAQSQAKVEDVPAQVDYLQQQLQTTYNQTVSFENDWKMVTILIGANNLCGACKNRSYAEPDFYEQQLDLVLTKLYKQIPRLWVNILPMFNISQVHTFAEKSDYCKFMWKYILKTECECLQGDSTDHDRQIMDDYAAEYRARINKITAQWAAKNLTEFAVTIQPFTSDLTVRGLEYLSELDCFHPSWLADGAFALGLWNNMMTAPADKQHDINPVDPKFKCPTADTFLQ